MIRFSIVYISLIQFLLLEHNCWWFFHCHGEQWFSWWAGIEIIILSNWLIVMILLDVSQTERIQNQLIVVDSLASSAVLSAIKRSTVFWTFFKSGIQSLQWLELFSSRIISRLWRILRLTYIVRGICEMESAVRSVFVIFMNAGSRIKINMATVSLSVRFVRLWAFCAPFKICFLDYSSVIGFEWKNKCVLAQSFSLLEDRP